MQESDALLAALAGRSVAADMFRQGGGMFSYRAQFTVQANPTSPLTENTALFLDDAKDYLAAGTAGDALRLLAARDDGDGGEAARGGHRRVPL